MKQANCLLIFICCFNFNNSFAIDSSKQQIPNLEFLEFLGSFETSKGKWLDPMELNELLETSELKQPTMNDKTPVLQEVDND